jgi:hypothetical protein
VVKEIFLGRDLPIFVLVKCEMADFCVVKRDLHAGDPWLKTGRVIRSADARKEEQCCGCNLSQCRAVRDEISFENVKIG